MTNKLTKQYRKGTLPGGFYYFKNKAGDTYAVDFHNLSVKGGEDVEVLSEVPSFDEYEKQKKHLKTALDFIKAVKKFPELAIEEECNYVLEEVEND